MIILSAKSEHTFDNLPYIFIDEPGDSGPQAVGSNLFQYLLAEDGSFILDENGHKIKIEIST